MALSACSGTDEKKSSDDAMSSGSSDFKACLVSDAGGWDDKSFNESAFNGLKEAEKEFNVAVNTAESKGDSDFGPNTQTMIDDGCSLIIGVGFLLAPSIKKAAEENTDLHFGLIDSGFTDKDGKPVELENGRALLFNTQEAAYLAGYVAAGATKTGTVATFGGIQIPSVTIFMDGFVDGVKAYNEAKGTDVKVLGWDKETQNGSFTNSFDDQALGKSQAQQFIVQGADIIMPVAGPVGLGAAAAAQEAENVFIIGVDSDWYESAADYKSIVITSVMKDIGESVKAAIKDAMNGKFESKPYVGTIENKGVSIAPFHDFDSKLSDELKSEVKDLEAKIASGDLKIESPAAN
ncbi:BMP family ABC transporter substrate-binding protein [Arcanobacterium pinnipediorum]|uniref:BMP family ABC transporter substrate-binding protein n=2 Tax=Arcanobacterium pinnipediorum TaxID=1503041 RepID=A0ABY5AJ43_9ACTO|nr:BMP family ABC transporter substrate-binding protein [Arcanobacterium pinnipediorum]USR80244.1 BMP family ABC transporter substrate-binding protein [Arcanobacterium pinnipediorum]